MADAAASEETLVSVTVDGGVAEIKLNRAHRRNALSRALISTLADAVARAGADRSVRLVVLAANGPAFCAGMDLTEMQQRAKAPDARAQWERDATDFRDLLAAILGLDVPTLAVVQGPAIAGGFGLVLACDLVLASTAARFALPELKRGISPAVVSPLLFYRMPAGPAMPILLTGNTLTGEEAYRLGLCHSLTGPNDLEKARQEVTASILAGAPGATAMTKRLIREITQSDLLAELEAGRKVSAEARRTAEAREGLAAYEEKRSPNWSPPEG